MRSLVFLALLGLALAVPVPHAKPDIFSSSEEFDPDCYADETEYEAGNIEDDLVIDNIVDGDLDCDEEPIEETDLLDIEIDYRPAVDEEPIIFENDPVEYIDEECEDEYTAETEAPPVFTRPPEPETVDNSDCESDDGEFVDELIEYEPAEEISPLDNYEHGFTDLDQVFDVEGESEAAEIEECIEY